MALAAQVEQVVSAMLAATAVLAEAAVQVALADFAL